MISMRSWATPVTIGAFLLISVTGILMFFHLDRAFIKPVHEWLSWALVVGVIAHLVSNYPAFKRYLHNRLALVLIGIFVVILGLSFLSFGGKDGAASPVKIVIEDLTSTQLETLAIVAKTSPEALVEKLKAHGLAVESTKQTLHDLSGGDRGKDRELISVVFGGR